MIIDNPQARHRFILHGILGTYNYGTESIVRGTVIALREVWPECEVVYVSPQPEDDQLRLQDSGVRIVPRLIAKRGSLRWGINVMFRLLGRGDIFISENMNWLRQTDCVLSVGGDLYTLPPQSMIAPNKHFYSTQLLDIGRRVLNNKIPFIVWGASIGPFETWPSAKQQFIDHLSKVTLITAREPLTFEYLSMCGIQDSMRMVADPAFLTPVSDYDILRKSKSLPLVGVNLSPLSVKYLSRNVPAGSEIQTYANVLVQLARQLNVELILLPHVISDVPSENDKKYLERIYEIVHPQIPDRVSIILDDPGARKMKGILRQCDVVISARMHCAIHAISVGTPALFLAYSAKARGMARYVYGDETFCMSIEDFGNPTGWEKIVSFLQARTLLRENLVKKQNSFVQKAKRAAIYLREILEEKALSA